MVHCTAVSSVREMTQERNPDICRHLSLQSWAGCRGNLEIQKSRKSLQEIHLERGSDDSSKGGKMKTLVDLVKGGSENNQDEGE